MKTTLKNLSVALMLAGMTIGSGAVAAEKVVIAHRGASGYLPEHRRKRWRMRKGQIIWNRI